MHRYFLLALCVYSYAGAATQWTAVKSPNFELYTTASPGDGRRAIEYFEQVRDFFMRVKSQQLTTRLPVTIVVFRNLKEFKPYSVDETAAAYYMSERSRDYIVMSGFDESHKDVAVHEYMHLLIRHMELNLPVWLDEGIAEVYSTQRPSGGKIVVGHMPQGRGWSLALQSWIRLPHLFSITTSSPEYNEKDRAGVLYAQSWLLTHMLMLDPRYSPKFGEFVNRVSAGASSEEALLSVYGKSVEQLQSDLSAYFRRDSLSGVVFNTKLEKLAAGEPQPANPFDVELTLARLTGRLDRAEEATARLERLANEFPKRWEPLEALGQIARRKGNMDLARTWLRKAVDLEPDGWSVYWDYARLAERTDSERPVVIRALRKVTDRNATLVDARLSLANELYRAGEYEESLGTLEVLKTIDAGRAPRLFLSKAHAALRLENFKLAREEAQKALKVAKEARDKQSAESILAWLDRRDAAESARVTHAQSAEEPLLPSVRGLLQEVDCRGPQARLLLQAGQRQIGFLIADRDRVVIRNAPATKVDLTCGKQAPGTSVVIEFEERSDREAGTIGDVRTLEFRK